MRQNLQNAEPSETIRIVRTEAVNAQNVSAEQHSVTAEEQRRNVTAALEMRRVQERRARLRKRVFAALTGTLILSVGLNGYFAAYLARRASAPGGVMTIYQALPAPGPAGALMGGVGEGELRTIPLSAVNDGQTAYADYGTIAKIAQGKQRANTIVSANIPFSSTTGPLHSLWEIIPRADGYTVGAYASPDAALRAANGGGATVYSETRDGLVRIEIPAQRFSGVAGNPGWRSGNHVAGEYVELPAAKVSER